MVPGLRAETASVGLFQPMGRRVAGRNVQIQHWSCCPQPDFSRATHFERISRRACVDFKHDSAGFGVASRSLIYKRQEIRAAAG